MGSQDISQVCRSCVDRPHTDTQHSQSHQGRGGIVAPHAHALHGVQERVLDHSVWANDSEPMGGQVFNDTQDCMQWRQSKVLQQVTTRGVPQHSTLLYGKHSESYEENSVRGTGCLWQHLSSAVVRQRLIEFRSIISNEKNLCKNIDLQMWWRSSYEIYELYKLLLLIFVIMNFPVTVGEIEWTDDWKCSLK